MSYVVVHIDEYRGLTQKVKQIDHKEHGRLYISHTRRRRRGKSRTPYTEVTRAFSQNTQRKLYT